MNQHSSVQRMGALSWVLIFAFLLTSLGQVNGVVLAQDEVPTETPAATEETPTPEVTETPEVPEPTEVLPTETPLEPTPTTITNDDNQNQENGGVSALDTITNDSIANATVIDALPYYSSAQEITSATIEVNEPTSVCNSLDSGSVWYKFTATDTGVFLIDVEGSGFYPNVSIFNRTGIGIDPVVCSDTSSNAPNEVRSQLAFNAKVGQTYLIGFSGIYRDILKFSLTQVDCFDQLCGVAIGGDGRVLHNSMLSIISENGLDEIAYTLPDWNGLIQEDIPDEGIGNYQAVISDRNNLIVSDVTIPGYFEPNATAYPPTHLIVKDTSGGVLSSSIITLFSPTNRFISTELFGASPITFYAPSGSYSVSASGIENGLIVYDPSITIDNSDPGIITIDASSSSFAKSTFVFNLDDNATDGSVNFALDNQVQYGFLLNLAYIDKGNIIFAAPEGTHIPYIQYDYVVDSTSGRWGYHGDLADGEKTIEDGAIYEYSLGGNYFITPEMEDTPYYSDSSKGKFSSSITDGNENPVDYVYSPTGYINPSYALVDASGTPVPVEFEYISYGYKQQVEFNLPTGYTYGKWTLSETLDFGPMGGEVTGTAEFDVLLRTSPANDLIPNATVMSLDTVYTANSAGSTISLASEGDELADPVNVCNTEDTYSLWYEFTAPADGVYIVNTYGSDSSNSRNVTVLQKDIDNSRIPVVCGKTNPYHYSGSEDYFKLAFNASQDTTYLIGISGTDPNDALSLQLQQYSCEAGHLCGAGVDGDGSVMNNPYIQVIDKNYSTDINGWGEGDFSGLIDFNSTPISEAHEGPFTILTSGDNSFLVSQGVSLSGYWSPTAIDLPKTTVTVRDISGNPVSYVSGVTLKSSDHRSISGGLSIYSSNAIFDMYVTPGLYDISVIVEDPLMYIYEPEIEIASSAQPHSLEIDASALAYDTFTFDLDDEVDGIATASIDLPNYFSWGLSILDGDSITVAAPAGSMTHGVEIQFENSEGSKVWHYNTKLDGDIEIEGGIAHQYNVGGLLQLNPVVLNQPVFIEDGSGNVKFGLSDPYDHQISSIYYYDYENGSFIDISPSYSVFDEGGNIISTATLGSTLIQNNFIFPTTGTPGTWSIAVTVDLGPSGGLQTASTTFTVDSLANHPVVNDDFDSATVIDSMPFSLEGYNTRGSTSAADDPLFFHSPWNDYGNSVWFKYTPDQNGILTLNTKGNDYGTYLSVWRGSRGSLSNLGSNELFYDLENDVVYPYSQVTLPVTAGQTYFIMIEGLINSYSPGYGILNLHGSLAANPNCYSLSVSSNSTTYGTVQVLTAPNCGTKYTEGTKVLLSAVAKPNYGFYNWSDGSTDDPYQVTINANASLKANFVKMIAPVVTAPAAGAVINDASPTFNWGATQYADTYQIQIDSQSNFALPIDQDETVDTLTYESPTLTPDGVKYYRVRAINVYGDTGPWSAVRSFTLDTQSPLAPILTAPIDAAWIVGVPTYTWAAVTGANAYRFEYDTNADFAHAVVSGVLSGTSYKPLEQKPGTYYWRVWASDAAGNWSAVPSNTSTVTVLAAVPPAPKINPFAGGMLTNSSTPALEWGAVYFAATYNIQISSVTNFAVLLADETVDADTLSYEFPAPNDGVFYARVRAFNALKEAGAWSPVFKFTVDTVAPGTPTLLSPIGASYPGTTTPKLSLAAVQTANIYEYQVDDSDSFATPILNVSSTNTGYVTTVSQALPFGLLYWRARAVDAAGNASVWSTPQSFYQTNQKTPTTTAMVTVATPTFTWSALAGATGYRLLVCQDEGMTDCVIDKTLGPVTKYVSPIVFSPAVYYWQISVVGGVYDGQTTLPIKFSVSPIIPASPKPYYPANGASLSDSTPGLSWTSVSTAVSYEVQINKASTFAADGLELTTGDATIVSTSLADGKFYWRVRAIDENGAFSKWSSISVFTVDTIKPDAPSLISPSTEEVVGSQLPKLTLSKVTDAALYEYQASPYSDFSTVILDKTVNAVAYTLVNGQQLPLGQIYWRARVIDAANNVSAWTAANSFWVTTQKLPANGSFITSAQPQFTWAAVPNALTYSLKVCKQVDLTDCVLAVDLNAVTGYKPSTSLDLGKYYWQLSVQTKDSSERMTSPVLSFTVTSASLAAPVLLAPVLNLTTNDTTVGLSWQLVPEAENYEVQISQLANFATLVESSTLPETAYTSTSLADGRYYWRVRTLNTYGAPGKWSAVRSFTVDTQATAAPVLVSPADGSLVNVFTPKLAVKAVSGAKSYQYQVFPTGSPADVWAEATTNAPTYTLSAAQALKFGSFSWRARTVDVAGNVSAWSAPVDFVMTLQKSPLDGSYTKVPNTTFTWAAFPGATGYRVKVCADRVMQTACFSSPDLSAKTLKYVPSAPLADGIYYWQIEVLGTTLENPVTPVLSFIKVH